MNYNYIGNSFASRFFESDWATGFTIKSKNKQDEWYRGAVDKGEVLGRGVVLLATLGSTALTVVRVVQHVVCPILEGLAHVLYGWMTPGAENQRFATFGRGVGLLTGGALYGVASAVIEAATSVFTIPVALLKGVVNLRNMDRYDHYVFRGKPHPRAVVVEEPVVSEEEEKTAPVPSASPSREASPATEERKHKGLGEKIREGWERLTDSEKRRVQRKHQEEADVKVPVEVKSDAESSPASADEAVA